MHDPRFFARLDESPDERFYEPVRLVEHIDSDAIETVTALYREHVPANADLLDLMSSWVSHLPGDVAYRSVVGLGMNAQELRSNPRLTRRVLQNLNAQPQLPFDDAAFDAALICVSSQYLTQPVVVFRELARVTRPGAKLIVTFSNRCFPTKAISAWTATSDREHLRLVAGYVRAAGGWDEAATAARVGRGDPLFSVIASRA